MIKKNTDATFQADIINSDIPVLLVFWAELCEPYDMLKPLLEKLGTDLNGKASIYNLNVYENPVITQKFGITAIPTVIVFKNGEQTQKLLGTQPRIRYIDAIN